SKVVKEGETRTVVITPAASLQAKEYSYKVEGTATLGFVAGKLKDKIAADIGLLGITATVAGARLDLNATHGTARFFVSFAVSPTTKGGAVYSTPLNAKGQPESTIKLTGDTTVGETWTLTVGSYAPLTYTVQFGDTLATVTAALADKLIKADASNLLY